MGVLKFDGVDDNLKWTTLASPFANISTGAWTRVVVVERNTATTYDAIGYLLSGTGNGTTVAGCSIEDVDTLLCDYGTGARTTATFTTGPYMLALSKTAGTTAPRLGYKTAAAGAWTHVNLGASIADQAAATMFQIGTWQGTSDPFDGWIGVDCWYSGAMSDVNKEALDDNWRTSDLYSSAHGTPVFLAELNVAGASVVDLIGNATVLTATGTTLDAAKTLDSWNFNGTGAAAAQIPFVVTARVRV